MTFTQRAVAGLFGIGLAALAWAGFERRWYVTRQESLALLSPEAAGPLRVLFFSDLHLLGGRQGHRTDYLRRAIADAAPDVLVSGGDLLEDEAAIDEVVALHDEIRGGRPAVAVLGAHDRFASKPFNPLRYFAGPSAVPGGPVMDTARLVDGLQDAGWEVLRNRAVRADTPAGPVDIAGLSDPHVRWDRPSAVQWTAHGPPPVLRLGVVHAPYARSLAEFDEHAYDLVLSGHTHGGQLRVPWLGALVTNSDLPAKHARGTSRWGVDLTLHVSAGLGHSRYYPIRFACRPELTVLDLLPRPAPARIGAPAAGQVL